MTGSTSRSMELIAVWFEARQSAEKAMPREKQIIEWKRGWKLNLIERGNPHWTIFTRRYRPNPPAIWRWFGQRREDNEAVSFSITQPAESTFALLELGLDCEKIPVDLTNGDHREPAFLAVNPAGRVRSSSTTA